MPQRFLYHQNLSQFQKSLQGTEYMGPSLLAIARYSFVTMKRSSSNHSFVCLVRSMTQTSVHSCFNLWWSFCLFCIIWQLACLVDGCSEIFRNLLSSLISPAFFFCPRPDTIFWGVGGFCYWKNKMNCPGFFKYQFWLGLVVVLVLVNIKS